MIRQFKKNPYLYLGLFLGIVMILLALFVPLFSNQSYSDQNSALQNLTPGAGHWFGTDKFGRDIFVRVFFGTRISLAVGLSSAVICGLFGILYGAVAGFAGGLVDLFLMRLADVIDAIPSLLYVILITLTLGANVMGIVTGICISGWIELARIVRGEVMRLKSKEFCMAAGLYGAKPLYLLRKHILPNAAGVIIVNLTFFIPKAIFTEAFLSFMGVGIGAPIASLGTLIQDARSQMRLYPYQMIYPILILCILIISFQMIGTGLEKKLDVQHNE